MDKFLVPRVPGAPLFVPKRDIVGERKKEARSFFIRELGVDPAHKPNRRPTRREDELYALFDEVVERYSGGILSVDDEPLALWWAAQPEHATWAVNSAAAAAPAAAAGDVDAGGQDYATRQEQQQHHYHNDAVRILYQNCAHVWAAGGSHMAWRSIDEFRDAIVATLGHTRPPRSTAGEWLKREKDAFDAKNVGVVRERSSRRR